MIRDALIPDPAPPTRRRAPLYPDQAERELREAMLDLTARWIEITAEALAEALDLPSSTLARADDDDDEEPEPAIVHGPEIIIRGIEHRLAAGPGPEAMAEALERAGVGVDRHLLRELAEEDRLRPMVAQIEIAGSEAQREAWRREAQDLIVRVQERHRDTVGKIIREGWERGWDQTRIADELVQAADVAEARARLWARDQIGTLNASLTERRQQDVGITHYRWRTSRDERVRDEHRAREGRLIAWSDPPSETRDDGHPGRPINCRCTAAPVMPDELDSEMAQAGPGAGGRTRGR